MPKVAILGCGAMGGAVARAVVQQLVVEPQNLLLVECLEAKGRELATSLGASFLLEPAPDLASVSVIVLAVKPQDAKVIGEEVSEFLRPDQLIISLMAGVTLDRISELFGRHRRIVRAMPNLPAQCGEGITVYCGTSELAPTDLELASRLFESFGRALRVTDEKLLDAATALSGTGPAYFYYVAAAMMEAAQRYGFTPLEAKLLVEQTMIGAAHLWKQGALSPAELVNKVASRGGTTEAALNVLKGRDASGAWQAAIEAARKRSEELSSSQE